MLAMFVGFTAEHSVYCDKVYLETLMEQFSKKITTFS
jgi:hypothetical protein